MQAIIPHEYMQLALSCSHPMAEGCGVMARRKRWLRLRLLGTGGRLTLREGP